MFSKIQIFQYISILKISCGFNTHFLQDQFTRSCSLFSQTAAHIRISTSLSRRTDLSSESEIQRLNNKLVLLPTLLGHQPTNFSGCVNFPCDTEYDIDYQYCIVVNNSGSMTTLHKVLKRHNSEKSPSII